jgi:hypothetical protein
MLPESVVVLSVGGGLLARTLRNVFAPYDDACDAPPLPLHSCAACDEPPPPHLLLLGAAVPPSPWWSSVEPSLRIPATSVELASWAVGALLAQLVHLLLRRLFRGRSAFRVHVGGAAVPRVEFLSTWRGSGRVSDMLVRGSPRKSATRALEGLMRHRDTATAIVVVNL